jgi:hypothetical protein
MSTLKEFTNRIKTKKTKTNNKELKKQPNENMGTNTAGEGFTCPVIAKKSELSAIT